jgi:hypothetical protein
MRVAMVLGALFLWSCSDDGARGPVTVKPVVDAGEGDGGYPTGPYGTEKNQVLANASFIGRRGGLDTPRETFDLESFRADKTKRYLIFNVAAGWCSPCKSEAIEFQDRVVPKYAPRGVAFLSVILQDSSRRPATDSNVDSWITAHHLTFPTVRDPAGFVNTIFNPDTMPLNMIIDLKTMMILEKIVGADVPRVEATLDRLLGAS